MSIVANKALALIELFAWIYVVSKWLKNRLLGKVIAANWLATTFSTSGKSPRYSPKAAGELHTLIPYELQLVSPQNAITRAANYGDLQLLV